MRPEIEPASSWILVGFVSTVPQWEVQKNTSFNKKKKWVLGEKKLSYCSVGSGYKQSLTSKQNNLLFGFPHPIPFPLSPKQHNISQVHACDFQSGPGTEDKQRSGIPITRKNIQSDRMWGSICRTNLVGRLNVKTDFQNLVKGFLGFLLVFKTL